MRVQTISLRFALTLAFALGTAGCATEPPAAPDDKVADAYPTLVELYSAGQGVYASCGPNNAVCHNSKQFPDLSSLGSILDHIGDPCNQLQDKPEKIHDLCERTGDMLVVGGARIEIGHLEAVDADAAVPQTWRIALAAPYPGGSASEQQLAVERGAEPGAAVVGDLHAKTFEVDAADPRILVITLPPQGPPVDPEEEEDEDPGRKMSALLVGAGVPADPASIQLGDPNRNGTFGAQLGGRLIKPGDPDRSFIMRRLTDPAAGPLMPLANCCHWSKAAVRALWCWIAGLDDDGANALDPIDYGSCPPGPAVGHLAYPEPGEGCESSGMCPIQSTLPVSSEPTWSNVYGNIMSRRCAGSGCHFDGGGAGLSLADDKIAYESLLGRGLVLPGDAEASPLVQRVAKPCAPGASCDRMPLGLDPLPDAEIEAIRGWIQAGAPR